MQTRGEKIVELIDDSGAYKAYTTNNQLKKPQQTAKIREEGASEKKRVYLPSLFNQNPELISVLRQIEDPNENEVINPRHLTYTGIKIPSLEETSEPGAVLRYKKERFEFNRMRPACVEIVGELDIPQDETKLTPSQRKAQFAADLETVKAQRLIINEKGILSKKAILRRRGMETAVMSGERDPLTAEAGMSPAQIKFNKQSWDAENQKRDERKQKLAFFHRTTAPLEHIPLVRQDTFEKYKDYISRNTKDDGALTQKPYWKGKGLAPIDGLARKVVSVWRRPSVRIYVPVERDFNIVHNKFTQPHTYLGEEFQISNKDGDDAPLVEMIKQEGDTKEVAVAHDDINKSIDGSGEKSKQHQTKSKQPTYEVIDENKVKMGGAQYGVRKGGWGPDGYETPGVIELRKKAQDKSIFHTTNEHKIYLDRVPERSFVSTNPNCRYPSSLPHPDPPPLPVICDSKEMTILPKMEREFDSTVKSQPKRHFFNTSPDVMLHPHELKHLPFLLTESQQAKVDKELVRTGKRYFPSQPDQVMNVTYRI
ncbi:MAG: hypothetical protein EZS28_002336 [Streblomastix strix]|uniref:Uncharacterized protein n=1 Tax=Streblomastix strix TaxID=222440 RepID=A0A5J4X5S3_9EUKA|nr:MAG: hypothetical protein EZS28_002336 [Streblomastix strix]